MEIEQSVKVLKQALDIAIGNGAFKSTEDVSTIHIALVNISKYVAGKQSIEAEASKDSNTKKK